MRLVRLFKVLLALLLGLVLCELGWGARHRGSGASERGGAGGAEVLCIGDSHTFGWNVDAEGAWPARLEGLLAADGVDWSVANRGAPGKNTETLLGELDEYLALDRPDMVLILAGLNNPWSRPHGEGATGVLDWSRTARLVKLLVSRVRGGGRIQGTGADGGGAGRFDETTTDEGRTEVRVVTREGDVETFVIGGETLAHEEVQLAYDWIKHDLIELAARVKAFGARPVLLTYALEEGEYLPSVNFTIREAAAEGELDLIDVAAAFTPVLDELGRERLFFRDAHPRREGYGAVAQVVHDGLVELGLVDAALLGDAFAELRGRPAPAPLLAVRADADGALVLEMTYDPALEYTLLLARAPLEVGEDWYGVPVALAHDELFALTQAEATRRETEPGKSLLRGSFGQGTTLLTLSRAELARWSADEGPLFGVLVGRTADFSMLAASDPVRLR
jgi:lysophospholipase L1-like esterase